VGLHVQAIGSALRPVMVAFTATIISALT